MLKLLQKGFDPNQRDKFGGRPVDEAEYWAVRSPDESVRKRCLECRKHLVLFHGRRSELQERVDRDIFVARLKKCEQACRRDFARAHIPWYDDLDKSSAQNVHDLVHKGLIACTSAEYLLSLRMAVKAESFRKVE